MPTSDHKILLFKCCYLGSVLIGHLVATPYLLIGKQILQLPMFALILGGIILYHVRKKSDFICLIICMIGVILWMRLFAPGNMLILIILVLDMLIYMKIPLYYGGLLYFLFGISDQPEMYVICLSFLLVIYYQYYNEIKKQEASLHKVSGKEDRLQYQLQKQDFLHKSEMASYCLKAENSRLIEKRQLVQALHDQLGHSINGSIFQLEACKLTMEKKPEETKVRMQNVIDELRKSMDAIRAILRKERPRDEVMSLAEIKNFCAAFQLKYKIEVDFHGDGSTESVGQNIWQILMDTLVEAFSNVLKYAQCDKIRVSMVIYPKMLRFTIQDNGVGCMHIKTGMGIQGISERVRKAGGNTDIEGEDGFRISLIIPLKSSEMPQTI